MTAANFVSRLLTLGGDRRICVKPGQNTNQYGSSPYPRSTLGYASSTANDISLPAFEHLTAKMDDWPALATSDGAFYTAELESLRARLRTSWKLPAPTDLVFAPSGTDLEYVALALAGPAVTNVLVGADEVGSGCGLAAGGQFFAKETALRTGTTKGESLGGLADTVLRDVVVRDGAGRSRDSAEIAAQIDLLAQGAASAGRTCLVHLVYGSKTGLVLPSLSDLDWLRTRHPGLKVVVDACQARVTSADLNDLLSRDCVVLLTGSKFIGGPPFSGMALVPPTWRPEAPIAAGLNDVFRRGEWPIAWSACNALPGGANPGLLLRIEAAAFELERYHKCDARRIDFVIKRFGAHVRELADQLGAGLVEPCLSPDALHTATLATLDLSHMSSAPDLAVAQRWHKVLAARGVRLGQPVKCVPLADGRWGGTLRLSLSMPLIGELVQLSRDALDARLSRDMTQIYTVMSAAQRGVA